MNSESVSNQSYTSGPKELIGKSSSDFEKNVGRLLGGWADRQIPSKYFIRQVKAETVGFTTSVQSASIVHTSQGYVVTVLGKSNELNPTNGITFKYNIPVASYADGSALVRDAKLGNVQCKGEPCILTYVNIP